MNRASGPVLIGTQTWAAGADAARRNAAGIASLLALTGRVTLQKNALRQ